MTYNEWIKANVEGTGYGACREVTERMAAAFPELRRVYGFYYSLAWGRRTHWWLVTSEGIVVDPTSAQFPCLGFGDYEELNSLDEAPTGRCADCACDVYNGAIFCSSGCESATISYLNDLKYADDHFSQDDSF